MRSYAGQGLIDEPLHQVEKSPTKSIRATISSMPHRLEILRAATYPTPRAHSADGMLVVACGDHTVQFARDADAQFYLAAHQDVPALLARIAELEHQVAALGQGELEKAKQRITDLEVAIVAEQGKRSMVEAQLEQQVAERTRAEARARVLANAFALSGRKKSS